jgi:hypothetical protein
MVRMGVLGVVLETAVMQDKMAVWRPPQGREMLEAGPHLQ